MRNRSPLRDDPAILRLIIVDDNERYRLAARGLLEREGIDVVGVASSGDEAVHLAADTDADVALVDIDLGPDSGFDVATRLVSAGRIRVVLISAYDETEFGDLVAQSGATGFIAKSDLSAAMIAAVLDQSDGTGTAGVCR